MKKLIVWAILLVGGGYLGAKFYLHYRVTSDLDDMLLMVSPFAKVDYRGVSSTIGGELSIDGVQVTVNGYRDPIKVESLTLVTPGFWYLIGLDDAGSKMGASDMPDSLGFAIQGLEIATDSDLLREVYRMSEADAGGAKDVDPAAECSGLNGYGPRMLRELGYDRLKVDMFMGYEKAGNDMLVDARAAVENMYDMNIEMTIDGGMSPKAMMVGAFRPRMSDGSLEFVDRSFMERISRLCRAAGLSDEQLLEAKLETFHALGREKGIAFDEPIVAAYTEFLGGKSTFTLTADPHEPVALSQITLYKPEDVPDLLNLSASAQ